MLRSMKGLVFALLIAVAAPASGAILVADDFDDNSLDLTKWSIDTSGYSGANVEEVDQHIVLTGRGYLNTAEQYDPADTADGILITGTWTFGGSIDMLQILTRSDGTPAGTYGETNSGIEFYAYENNEEFTIRSRGSGMSVSNLSVHKSAGFKIDNYDVFEFAIFDDGYNLSFKITEVGGDGVSAWATATSTSDPASDYVVFHNRESTSHVALLDDVVIQSVPEPSTLAMLAGLGGLGLLGLWRRRRTG